MPDFNELIKNKTFTKALSVVILVILAFWVRPLLNLTLMTFIFCFIFHNLELFINKKLSNLIKFDERITTFFVYAGFGLVLTLLIIAYLPLAKNQVILMADQISNFDVKSLTPYINDAKVLDFLTSANTKDILKNGGNALVDGVASLGKFAINLVIAFILSFFLLFDKKGMRKFGSRISRSKIGFLCDDFAYFGNNFVNTFGRVIQLQIIIASVNAVLSFFVLAILGFHQVFGLVFMIFFLGLIPVAGVIISFIPLSIIAFQIGGIMKVVSVIVMILVLHSLESYILNPKLMSIKVKMPVFIVFAVLVVSEHILGVWGLLVGIPLFIFITDLLGIKPENDLNKVD